MIRINLLPVPKVKKQEKLIIESIVGVAAIAGVTVICFITGSQMAANIQRIEQENVKIEAQINELRSKVGEVETFKAKVKTLNEQLNVIKDLEKGRSGPVRVMDELTDLVPKKLWITTFSEDNGNVSIEGAAVDGTIIADFLESLKASKFFVDPRLENVTGSGNRETNEHKFSIKVKVKYNI